MQAPAEAAYSHLPPRQEQSTAAVPIQAATGSQARQQDSSVQAGPGWSPWQGSAFSPASGGGGGGLLGALNLGPPSEEHSSHHPSQLSARSVDSLPPFAVPGRSIMGGSAVSGLRSISAQMPRPPMQQQLPVAGLGAASGQLLYGYGGAGLQMQKEDEELLDALCCPITQVLTTSVE